MQGEAYKQATAQFMAGENADLRSTGSVFKKNQAAFFAQSRDGGFKIEA